MPAPRVCGSVIGKCRSYEGEPDQKEPSRVRKECGQPTHQKFDAVHRGIKPNQSEREPNRSKKTSCSFAHSRAWSYARTGANCPVTIMSISPREAETNRPRQSIAG